MERAFKWATVKLCFRFFDAWLKEILPAWVAVPSLVRIEVPQGPGCGWISPHSRTISALETYCLSGRIMVVWPCFDQLEIGSFTSRWRGKKRRTTVKALTVKPGCWLCPGDKKKDTKRDVLRDERQRDRPPSLQAYRDAKERMRFKAQAAICDWPQRKMKGNFKLGLPLGYAQVIIVKTK